MAHVPRLAITAVLSGLLPGIFPAAVAGEVSIPSATLLTGLELDDHEGYRLDLGYSARTASAITLDLYASRSDAASGAFDLRSTSLFGKVGRDFGFFDLGAGVRRTRDEGLTKTLGWLGSAGIDLSGARIAVSLESRATDFDDSPFTVSASELGFPLPGSVSGIAACSVDSLGYALDVRIERANWSWYASGISYDYSSFDCDADSLAFSAGQGGGNGRVRVTRLPVVERLTTALTSRLGGYLSTRISYEQALIESTVMLGGAWYRGDRAFGAELYRSSEALVDADTTTALGYFTFPVRRSVSMELSLGASDTEGYDSILFGGARILISLY